MELNLAGKVAIVTGASRGIGAAIAQELAREGCSVVLASRSAEDLKARAKEIGDASRVEVHPSDLREPAAPAALVAATIARFGRLDIVVCNAGATKRGDFLALTDADWQDGFALKFFAHTRLAKAAWPHLRERKGSVVLISGVGGRTPGAEFTIGGSVNAAVQSFGKALADRGAADGVQVNTVNPGDIRTDRFDRRLKAAMQSWGVDAREAEKRMVAEESLTRIGEPADVANLVSFIVSPRGSYLHGALIDIDGGKTKTM
ncbi:MAG TPA: SDR family oxidoreductase [Stellaceae bacterium]|nr:SDR family oxidoreductase [Stellaceae bacterium]